MFDQDPSIAAIVVPFDRAGAEAFVAKGMRADGFRPARAALPKAQLAFPTESVSFAIAESPKAGPTSVLIVPDVARVFDLACILSKGSPETVITAFRRFAASAPVAKVIFGGRPQWKDGDDPDHEVAFNVPDGPSTELRIPSPIRVPTLAAEILGDYGDIVVRAMADFARADGASHWLHRRSRHGG